MSDDEQPAAGVPKWLRVAWWSVLMAALTSVLYLRLLAGGVAQPDVFEIILFVSWFALAALPLVAEVDVIGVRFRKQIRELRESVRTEIQALRADVSATIRSDFSPHTTFLMAPPDSQLPELERRVTQAVERVIGSAKAQNAPIVSADLHEPSVDTQYLFALRYNLEEEVKRIHRAALLDGVLFHRGNYGWSGTTPVAEMVSVLANTQLLKSDLASAVKDLYAICSKAIHAEGVSESQVRFAREVGPGVIAALRSIGSDN